MVCNFHSFFEGLHICCSMHVIGVIRQSGFTHALIHANFTSHTTSSPLSVHMAFSLHHPGMPSPSYLPTFSSLPQSSPSKQYNERLGGIISAVSLGLSHTNSNCSQTHRSLDTALVYLSLANPVLKLEVGRNPGSSHLKLSSSR